MARLENFRVTRGYGFKGFKKFTTRRQDKGHASEIEQFIKRVEQGGIPLIPFEEIVNATQASFAAVEAASTGETVALSSRRLLTPTTWHK